MPVSGVDAWYAHLRQLGRGELVEACNRLEDEVAPWREDHVSILQRVHAVQPAEQVALAQDAPAFGVRPDQRNEVEQLLRDCMPWRKGPWQFGDVAVDAEWRSELKWRRTQHVFADVRGKTICDLGSGNGYTMARLLEREPAFVLGIDPQPIARLQWGLVSRLCGPAPWWLAGWRADALKELPRLFDRILCAGLLYHVSDPVGLLRDMRGALALGGCVVIETIVVPGDEPIAWHPPARYGGARGFHALPTQTCLAGWLRRAGLTKQQWGPLVKTTPEEQRPTEWTKGGGIAVGLDPQNDERTIEGLPAPWRVVVVCEPG